MSLSEIIIERIRKEGPISFHEFMEMALYYPEIGYYNSPVPRIGKRGDYFTGPYASFVFGEMLARQLTEMWQLTGKGSFNIVEYGAGDGSLCRDILKSLKTNCLFYENLNYYIIERNAFFNDTQGDLLSCEKIKRISSISEVGKLPGCILANEVIDNFPVHVVEMQDGLMEMIVDYENGFKEMFRPASDELKNYIQEMQVSLMPGYRTEINLNAIKWMNEIAMALETGFLIIIDYGFSSTELYHPQRTSGTLISYYNHSVNNYFFQRIGYQDITAHVNFSALQASAIRSGLKSAGFTKQSLFLQTLGLTSYIQSVENSKSQKIQLAELIAARQFLIDMGQKLKVLILYKNLEKPLLKGLQFCLPLE